MEQTVLITGGAGFLGSHLAERYLLSGHRVIALDNFATGRQENIALLQKVAGDRFLFIEADVCKDWSTWIPRIPASWMTGLKSCFHFASPASPPHYQRLGIETMWVNTLALEHCLRFADQLGAHVTFASTSEVYGDPEVSPQTESYRGWVNTWGPRACYDEAKRFGEALIYTWNQKRGTQHGCVRIFNTYGPRMNPVDGRVIINFLVQALNDQKLTIYGTGQQTRSFCYVDDLVDGIVLYSTRRLSRPVNIGSEGEFSVKELGEMVRQIFAHKNLEFEYQPLPADDPKQRRPDLTLARECLAPWGGPKVDLKSGLLRMVDWLDKELRSKPGGLATAPSPKVQHQ
ncbi:MAG: NAD-dependent epimerase/dehydratase family protein [Bdellovibrionaceae bacterium]|nr:NAD-dependent epimerase/dehydratase family protein [Pseudobdellovibrionaceae bacterium]